MLIKKDDLITKVAMGNVKPKKSCPKCSSLSYSVRESVIFCSPREPANLSFFLNANIPSLAGS